MSFLTASVRTPCVWLLSGGPTNVGVDAVEAMADLLGVDVVDLFRNA